jgi:hypothetical protein
MSKERRTVSLKPENDAYLSQDGVNASELVDSLVEQYRKGGTSESQVQQLRLRQLKSEAELHKQQLEAKRDEMQMIRSDMNDNSVDESTRQDWFEKVRMVPRETDHPVVQDAADALEMDPADVLREAYDG